MKTLLLILMFAWSAHAATYFVDVTNGLDSNNGTSSGTAWQHIQKSITNAVAGDTVNVAPGLYNEWLTLRNSGSSGSPITFQSSTPLAAIIDPSTPETNGWVTAPEVGAGVYKLTTCPFETKEMTINGLRVAFFMTNGDMTAQWNANYTSPPTTTGLGGLALPANQTVTLASGAIVYPFWQGTTAMYCSSNTTTWLRFADGHNPNGENIRIAPNLAGSPTFDVYWPALQWNGQSYVTWRGFKMRGAFCQIDMESSASHGNIVESNYLAGGTHRMYLWQSYSNTVRYNEMTTDFYGTNQMGAWSAATSGVGALSQNLWSISKFLMGGASVADHGVRAVGVGSGNAIIYNNIHHGLGEGVLIGNITGPYCSNNVIAYNNITNLVSHCIMFWPFEYNTYAYSNFLADANINTRWHIMDQTGDTNRVVFIFRNKSWEPPGIGEHIYTHFGDSSGNTTIYPTFYYYNNSCLGGEDFLQVSSFVAAQGGLTNCSIFNNLVCSNAYYMNNAPWGFITNSYMIGAFDYNVITGPYPNFPTANDPAWLGSHVIKTNMWWSSYDQTFAITSGNIGINQGVDVTSGATISGKVIPALPQGGTKPALGWDIGAVELAGGPPTGNVYFKYRLR